MNKPKVYEKHNSFAGIRHKTHLPNVLNRIERMQQKMDTMDVDEKMKAVIQQACGELHGKADVHGSHAAFMLHSNVIEEINRLHDNELPRYLFYRFRYETYPQRKILDNFPPCLQVEPASVCNYRCIFCYQIDKEFTKKGNGHMGMMALSTFKRIIDEAEGKCEAITLASRGEPFACPDIKEMLAYTRGKFLALKLNTNASLLDEEKCHAILEAGVSTLVFSADAAAEPSYSQFRVGGNLERVLENVKMFKRIKESHYADSRMITRVSGVKVPGTPELDEMEKFWGELVDQVAFVNYNPWENAYVAPENDIVTPCSDLWRRMFVWWDGTVNPCDVDYMSTLTPGNIEENSLSELWLSEGYMQLREKHREKRRRDCSPCKGCVLV